MLEKYKATVYISGRLHKISSHFKNPSFQAVYADRDFWFLKLCIFNHDSPRVICHHGPSSPPYVEQIVFFHVPVFYTCKLTSGFRKTQWPFWQYLCYITIWLFLCISVAFFYVLIESPVLKLFKIYNFDQDRSGEPLIKRRAR